MPRSAPLRRRRPRPSRAPLPRRAVPTREWPAAPGALAAAGPFFALLEHLPDVYFFVKNIRSEFVHANAGFVEMLGAHRLDELVGRTDFDFSPRELASNFVRDDRRVMETGRPLANKVELVPNWDGSIRWHVTSKVPLFDGRGAVCGLAGFTRDLHKAGQSLRGYRTFAPVVEHIDAHHAEPLTVAGLAGIANLSVSQFERQMRRLFHVTPIQYLTRVRINHACRRLATTNAKLADVAAACGFYDHSHFTRHFARALGMTPGAYRRLHGGLEAGRRDARGQG
jgi:PAS domain S-box-containing protein